MSAFHAYDIRGIYNQDFNKEDVYKVGFFLPELLQSDKVLVGRDVRTSSPEIYDYLTRGITDAGADVYDLGLSTTPMVYWCTAEYQFKASVQITASHNSKEYNGLKVSRENALPVGLDTGLGQIKSWMESRAIEPKANKGKIIPFEKKEAYLAFQKGYLADLSNLNMAVDCSNGMAGLFIQDILGSGPHYLFEEMDGSFPNHDPNPLVEKNVEALKQLVKEQACDIGVIFDGDADRVMFVDEKGQFISPDLIIALLAHYFVEEKGLKGQVLQDIRTSKAVAEYIEPMGCTMNMWRVGRAFAAVKLRELDGIFGGELAGHYYFKDFFYSDSGILAALLVLDIVSRKKKEGLSLSALIQGIRKYANSGEINFKIQAKQEAMDAVRAYFVETESATAQYDFDGYRIEFADWWFNIRPSNTEPYLRLLAEARSEDLLAEKLQAIKSIIHKFE